jgi:hypothetical protein
MMTGTRTHLVARLTLVVLLVTSATIGAATLSSAAPSREEVEQAQARLDTLNQELDQIGAHVVGSELDDRQAGRQVLPRIGGEGGGGAGEVLGGPRGALGLPRTVHEGGDLLGQHLLAVAPLGSLGVHRHDVGDRGDRQEGQLQEEALDVTVVDVPMMDVEIDTGVDVPSEPEAACGHLSEPCCSAGPGGCETGTTCSAGLCAVCGGSSQPCCDGVCNGSNTCVGTMCRLSCGGIGESCCAGSLCGNDIATCVSGMCQGCGGPFQPCCGTNCQAGFLLFPP